MQSNGDVWEYNLTSWIYTGINLKGPAGPQGLPGSSSLDSVTLSTVDSLQQVVSYLDSSLNALTSLFVFGCMDTGAFNYNPSANINDGSCRYTPNIGDSYQGGIVFYLDGNGGGLIAAPTDQSLAHQNGAVMEHLSEQGLRSVRGLKIQHRLS